jgi:putative hydrolase of the HAD superfamily
MRSRAVVFDLWETLVRWPQDETQTLRAGWADQLGVSAERFDQVWYEPGAYERRESGPLRPVLATMAETLGREIDLDELLALRIELTRRILVPAEATVDALTELRRRGLALGVVSNCTEDVAIAWPETELAPLFDAAVFSSVAGCMKPDPRIYALVTDALEVEPTECLFVGDGANDELGGAERVGMTPVLIHRVGEEPAWNGLRDWPGARVTSIPEVLELVA